MDILRDHSVGSVGKLCCDLQIHMAVDMSCKEAFDHIGAVCNQLIDSHGYIIAVAAACHIAIAVIARERGGVSNLDGILTGDMLVGGIAGGDGFVGEKQDDIALFLARAISAASFWY